MAAVSLRGSIERLADPVLDGFGELCNILVGSWKS